MIPTRPIGRVQAAGRHAVKRGFDDALHPRDTKGEFSSKGGAKPPRKPTAKKLPKLDSSLGAPDQAARHRALSHSELMVEANRSRNSAEVKKSARDELARRDGKKGAPAPSSATAELRPDQQKMLKALTHSELTDTANRRSSSALIKKAAHEELDRRDLALRTAPKATRRPPKKPVAKKK